MNRDFLSNFERPDPKTKAPGPQNETAEASEQTEFADNEYIRNICFVWPDGVRKFISYARLDSGEISPEHDTIRLAFGPETVELIGIGLLPLFESFIMHKRKLVYCDDARYNDLNEKECIVNKMVVIKC